ncbi:uncharacterized protein LOC143601293 [Bidens hawaiensis]|uniref:uncharacterized protein LOC143601293 n=1 Tax=Bidens hawaiensis TaxID=980011 RepID=UPI00404A9D29
MVLDAVVLYPTLKYLPLRNDQIQKHFSLEPGKYDEIIAQSADGMLWNLTIQCVKLTTPRFAFAGMWEDMSAHCKLAVNDYFVFQCLQGTWTFRMYVFDSRGIESVNFNDEFVYNGPTNHPEYGYVPMVIDIESDDENEQQLLLEAVDVDVEDDDEPVLVIIVPHVLEENILEAVVRKRLRLPIEFARNNNLDVETDLMLTNPNGVDVETEIAIELNVNRIFDTLRNITTSTQITRLQSNKENVSPSTTSNVVNNDPETFTTFVISAASKRKERRSILDAKRTASVHMNKSGLQNTSSGRIFGSNVHEGSNASCVVDDIPESSRTVRRRSRNRTPIVPIPMADLSEHATFVGYQNVLDVYKGISSEYLDHGNQSVMCPSCNALLWKAEVNRPSSTNEEGAFSLCCYNGKVKLPDLRQPDESYLQLFRGETAISKYFVKNIRRFNSMFSFTSMGGKIDHSINRGNAPYTFRLSGENYHCLGSLLPLDGRKAQFSQLYIYDTENEISNRQSLFGENNSKVDNQEKHIINYLNTMLDSNNHLVQAYRMVRDCFEENPQLDLKLRIIGTRQHDARQYNLPSSSEVVALIVGDIGDVVDNRDIIVTKKSASLKRISELHLSYTPLQYPLFHPFGEDGYQVNILHKNVSSSSTAARKKVTMREFFAYRIQDRANTFSTMLNGRRLFQQIVVDKYTMIEAQRLHFILGKQHELRCDTYQSLRGMQAVGNTNVSTDGQHKLKRFLKDTKLNSKDRPDILCRLFKVKLDAMTNLVKDKSLFGRVQAVVYMIEFQKRGLPHAHICIFLHPGSKIHNPKDVHKFISAKIPNKDSDPDLYKLVSDHMIHDPCGDANPKCTCMVNKRCSKNFPKIFNDETAVDSNGFPVYKRRDNGQYVVKSDIMMDNRTVFPYNKTLLKKFQAHVNVEWCNQDGSIKYLFKYINKGPDRATISLVQNKNGDNQDPNLDEIKAFYDCRYVSACEAAWRIFGFDVHYRFPSVMRLAFHLPGEQQVIYGANEDIEDILNKTTNASSMFTGWFECNKKYDLAKTLTYAEFPTKYVWKNNVVKGPQCFEDIRTVDGVVCETFRDACYKRGLLDDDKEYIEAIEEASHTSTGYYLRNIFATMLITYSLSRPHFVWESTWQLLVDGILYKQQKDQNNPGLILNEEQLKNLALLEIENFLICNNSSLRRHQQMPFPDIETISRATNSLMVEELSYDTETMNNEFNHLFDSLTDEQRGVYNEIMNALVDKKGGVFFVYGYGGTGKTYLWKTLSTSISAKGDVVLNVASSGIASLLLEGGRTAHSRFLIPINLTEDSICPVKGNTDVYELLRQTSLIIWDEAPMIHKHAFEALDRTLNDVMNGDSANTSEALFGCKVVFGGDFRQILPVVTNGTRSECVNACINSSYIWSKCKVLKLTKNMRLTVGCRSSDVENIKEFADWLLDIGQGTLGGPNDGESVIDIPDDLFGDLIRFVYPDILDRFNELTYFQDRALLAPLNEVVQKINERMLALFPGDEVQYLSSDILAESEDISDAVDPHLYSPDLLNGLKMSGMPNHRLVLKVGVPIMLLRNINHKKGLCNGTRLQVVSLGRRVIEAKVVSGTNIGYRTLISRVSLTSTDKKLSFKLKRRQFPISVCFSMTINKSQGQSLSRVGLYLKDPVFSHGQLYVALSRVKTRDGIKLVILDKESKLINKTTNVVYKEIFANIEC